MKTKGIIDEDFVNYKKPSMVILFPTCTFKCEKECGERCCQNSALAQSPTVDTTKDVIISRYLNNSITKAVVCGGLEPMDSFFDLYSLVYTLRNTYKCLDDVVIYTGYTKNECTNYGWLQDLMLLKNVVIKFGRFIPNQLSHYDEVLGVRLASDNQYAERIC